ncbi:hypothetical protein F511_38553 [Dorcoceras hygrometricum]|uniref:CCHC-type domain-containing protein n=1 Tax=Dorcoceras hygrometricum TaxID=472368 RepID=A0A2Z7DE07_9LAMI|nr:hypothetical protein F511_38553 [Dorcoceras hygrometricum]
MPRGQQFKKKQGSSSSGSCSSSSSSSPRAIFCGQCGGRHPSAQCTGVQGACNNCGKYGHFARVCPLAGSQQAAAPPQGRACGSSRGRSFLLRSRGWERLNIGRFNSLFLRGLDSLPNPKFQDLNLLGECHDEGASGRHARRSDCRYLFCL